MKKKRLILPLFFILIIEAGGESLYNDILSPLEKRVEDLLSRMSIEEKVAQTLAIWQKVGGEGNFSPDSAQKYFPHGLGALHRRYLNQSHAEAASESNKIQKHFIDNTRLGIPVLINTEGLHGLMAKNTTIFPQAIALASTWDEELFHRIYTAVALETRALGIQQLLSPNLDGHRMVDTDIHGTSLLAGETAGLHTVMFQVGSGTIGKGPLPNYISDLTLLPGTFFQTTFIQAASSSETDSFDHARSIAARPWEAEIARIEMINANHLQIITGNKEWNSLFALAQQTTFRLLIDSSEHLPHPSFVLSRQPDQGYSMRGDGSDYNYLWNNWRGTN